MNDYNKMYQQFGLDDGRIAEFKVLESAEYSQSLRIASLEVSTLVTDGESVRIIDKEVKNAKLV